MAVEMKDDALRQTGRYRRQEALPGEKSKAQSSWEQDARQLLTAGNEGHRERGRPRA
jgi:hypothetical protein